jgi:uncharacterized protein YbjT (DUF2867 family)
MSIAITTPTGHIGSRLVRRLLDAGADLTLLLRNPDKLDSSIRNRVKVQQGTLDDKDYVQRATAGAEALFWLTPGGMTATDVRAWYDHFGQVAANAVQSNRIPYVVHLSSVGAQNEHAGLVSGLGRVERYLNATPANVLHLRPAYFMENYLMQLDAIRSQSCVFLPVPGEAAFPLIATRDIADVAAEHLLARKENGKRIRGLHGPADVRFDEAASILGEAIGRPVRHVTVTLEQVRQTFLGWGASPAFADAYVEMAQALSQPGTVAEPRTPETTTPTTLAQWAADTFRPLFYKEIR